MLQGRKGGKEGSGEDRHIPTWLSNYTSVEYTQELLSGSSASPYLQLMFIILHFSIAIFSSTGPFSLIALDLYKSSILWSATVCGDKNSSSFILTPGVSFR